MKKTILAWMLAICVLVSCCSCNSSPAISSEETRSIPEESVASMAEEPAPTPSPTAAPTPTPSPTPAPTPSPTPEPTPQLSPEPTSNPLGSFSLESVPKYDELPYVPVNGDAPFFTEADLTTEPFEEYAPLDSLGRCGIAFANICPEIMLTEQRGSIGEVEPSGWQLVRYDDLVDGNYLYNRCHLIGYQLAGENSNERNLITGTRYLNTVSMLLFENQVAEYVSGTGNHVLYRVTPIFVGDELVARGVLMEGYSVEDEGQGVNFCQYLYNIQPGVEIDYATGDSVRTAPTPSPTPIPTPTPKPTAQFTPEPTPEPLPDRSNAEASYVLNKNTKKFHYPYCSSVEQMKESNKVYFEGTRDEAIAKGYQPCKKCNP